MKKVLLLSYFFPPCNLTAANRVGGWFEYLKEYGYYPIVITRNWDIPVVSPEDALVSSGEKLIHTVSEKGEVYYLPYKASKRDEIYSKNKDNKKKQQLSKLYTVKDLLLENYSNTAVPFSNMYDFAKELLQREKDIKLLVISANPFIQFKFGYLLNQKFGIKWIADYRDDWNTSELPANKSGIWKVINKIQAKNEKKWVGTAECITSISAYYSNKISAFVQRPGKVVLNGFSGLEMNGGEVAEKGVFRITYNGSLYASQPIELFLGAVKKCLKDPEITLPIEMCFPGLAFDEEQKRRVENTMKGFESVLKITQRIPRNEVVKIQMRSDILLMIAHKDLKGIPSSKLYEYIGLKKQIFLCPNDHDIIESTLVDTELGVIADGEKEVYEKLKNLILQKQQGIQQNQLGNLERIGFYSRREQTKALAVILQNLDSN